MSGRCLLWGVATSVVALAVTATSFDRQAFLPSPARDVAPSTGAPSGESLYQLTSVWTTDGGAQVRLEDLRGCTRVLAMMFTHCPSLCPTLVRDLKKVDAAMPEKTRQATRYVLVTIDPEHDTPGALRAFRTRFGLDPRRWLLLRGNAHDTQELAAVLGFNYGKGDGRNYTHSNLVTVLNRQGEIVHQEIGMGTDPTRAAEVLEGARIR